MPPSESDLFAQSLYRYIICQIKQTGKNSYTDCQDMPMLYIYLYYLRKEKNLLLKLRVLLLTCIVLIFALINPTAAKAVSSPPPSATGTLVLYDSTGQWKFLGDLYGQLAQNLASRFGSTHAEPVSAYTAGQMRNYRSVIYIGSTYDEKIPQTFLDDVLANTTEVLWAGANVWQLDNRANTDNITGRFEDQYGWKYISYDTSSVTQVRYKNRLLDRSEDNAGGILNLTITDPKKAIVKAEAIRANKTTFPWETKSGKLTYIGEVPLSYFDETDRYLIFADTLFDINGYTGPERHRGLVRLEDVGPNSDPVALRKLADVLFARKIPFSVALYPVYANGKTRITLADRPKIVEALRYMKAHGGTLISHGYTHQLGNKANPYRGISGEDFEFYTTHIDKDDNVVLDGPVVGDSELWATNRMTAASKEIEKVGFAAPQIWEFPHYIASVPDYSAAAKNYPARYERGTYFANRFGKVDYEHNIDQYFPYEVTDVYGTKIIPENIGNVQLVSINNEPPIFPSDLVARAKANLVVRDGYASLFFHTFYSPQMLAKLVDDIKNLGYTYVSPASVLAGFQPTPMKLPPALTNTKLTLGKGNVTVSFTPIKHVNQYHYTINGGKTWSAVSTRGNSVKIVNLKNNYTYKIQIKAVNIVGAGPQTPIKTVRLR